MNNNIPDASKMVEEISLDEYIKHLETIYNKKYKKINLNNKYNKYWCWAMFNTCLLGGFFGVLGSRIVFEWILEPIVELLTK